MKKRYIKPAVVCLDVRLRTELLGMSQEDEFDFGNDGNKHDGSEDGEFPEIEVAGDHTRIWGNMW